MSRESLIDRELDEEFIKAIIVIQNATEAIGKHDKVKVQAWITKLAKITVNHEAKRSRNLYVAQLYDCINARSFAAPFDKQPPAGSLPLLRPQAAAKHKHSIGKLMKTEEIEKIIESNLMSLNGEEVFELSPRDTFPNRTVKFDSSTIYEITPSKSNRLRARESAQGSRRESKYQSLLKPIGEHSEAIEAEKYSKMSHLRQVFANISSLISSHVADMKPEENAERLKEVLNLAKLGEAIATEDLRELELANKQEVADFKRKYSDIMQRLDLLEHKNVVAPDPGQAPR